MLSRLLYLEPGHLRRAGPFFLLYLVLFVGLTLADALSLTLVVQQLGAEALPLLYAVSAVFVMAAMGGYLAWAGPLRSSRVFALILVGPAAVFALAWAALCCFPAQHGWLGALLIGRELGFALVLLHFGTFLQDYFNRSELNRVMPVIYAGGRVGGIAGGAALEQASVLVDPLHLLPAVAGLLLLGAVVAAVIGRMVPTVVEPESPPSSRSGSATDQAAPCGLIDLVWRQPLMRWITLSTALLFACRVFLGYRCGEYFSAAFASETEMAAFLGRYTQCALAVSLLLQLLLINRWIAWFGLGGAHRTYGVLLLVAACFGSLEMTLSTAIFARLVEGELRYSLRNPVAQMTVNQFSRPVRLRVRAWSLGLLIPLSTLAACMLLTLLVQSGLTTSIPLCTVLLGAGYLLATLALARRLQPAQRIDIPATTALPSPTDLRAVSSVG